MKSKPMLFAWAAWLLAIPLASAISACHYQPPQSAAAVNQEPAGNPVEFVAVSEQTIDDRLDLSAKVQADSARLFRVFPPASGRVLAITVKPGDSVRRGEALASIDSADGAAAQSDLTKAEIEAERAQREADREKVLFDHGAVAEKDYIDAKAAADSARAELVRARRHLEALGMGADAATDRIPLLAPGRGIVLSVNAAPGELSKSLDNADPLMTIADLSTVWIMGDVFEKDIAKVQPGTHVTVTMDAFPRQQWAGKIDSIAGALDPTTRTLKVRVALKNPGDRLKPDMFATIHVDLGRRTAIVVPSSAVIHEGQNTIVLVDNDAKPERRNVTTGQAVDGKVEITSGLQTGQKVAVNGAELLTGGTSQP
jgi:cobalt-zinc-cadmium efflux system membrane fusion protein